MPVKGSLTRTSDGGRQVADRCDADAHGVPDRGYSRRPARRRARYRVDLAGRTQPPPGAYQTCVRRGTPEFYRRVPDPYIALAAIAAATTTIRLGTGISLPAEHNPLTMAKALATLDRASGGRFEWGYRLRLERTRDDQSWAESEASHGNPARSRPGRPSAVDRRRSKLRR
jgi:Luciferase-like monooxygenase